MYLFTFMLLMISIMGLFTQVSAVQTAKFFASQSAFGASMRTWHEAIVSYTVSHGAPAGYPCTLSNADPGLGLPGYCFGAPFTPPTGDRGLYVWSSVLYSSTAPAPANYVVTFATLHAGSTTVSFPPIGITLPELSVQMKNAKVSPFIYGTVISGSPNMLRTIAGNAYPVDSHVPLSSLAIVSQVH